jgi:hypothetical protein
MAKVRISNSQAELTAGRLSEKEVRAFLFQAGVRARLRASHGDYVTGRLAASVRSEVKKSFWRVNGRLGSDLPQARWKDRGTKRHDIEPLGQYPLRFFWRRTGRIERFWHVDHPGYRGDGWLTKSVEETARQRGWRFIQEI